MDKVKVRCSVCGRPFKTPSAKKTVCPACEAQAKRAKHQASAPAAAPAVASTSSVDVRAALRAAQENQGQFGAYRPPAPPPPAPAESPAAARSGAGPQGRVAAAGRREERDAAGKPRAPREARVRVPRPPREPKPRLQQKPFEPTPEQAAAVRERYLALAKPEFDGIRHQIATELGIPLRAVKELIKKAREEAQIQSWWERSGGLISQEDLEKIKSMYVPLLPEPEIGVHKGIAAQLHLTNTSVYLAIGQIRAELELPRYLPREGMPASAYGEAFEHPTPEARAAHGMVGADEPAPSSESSADPAEYPSNPADPEFAPREAWAAGPALDAVGE